MKLTGGDYAINPSTGEVRLVIEYSSHGDEVTFSGSMRWESAKSWRSHFGQNVRPTRSGP